MKEGHPVSMTKIEAMVMQLFNKAMGGYLGAAKALLK